jgi:two-component system, NarL family, sensor histidine kinase DevS
MSNGGSRRDPLVEAGLVLASELSLPAVLQKIADLACDIADARYGALGVLGPDGLIEQFITHGVTEEERRAIGHIPVGKGILGALIHDGTPLRLRHIQQDPRSVGFPANHPPMTSFLGVPVKIRNRVYGNLYLTEKRGAAEFTAEDEQAVVTLATQAAVAIENARLYEAARSHQRRLEAIGEVMQTILAGRELDEALRLVAGHARNLVAADLATIAMPSGADELTLRVAEGANADELRGMSFPVAVSLSGEVMRRGEPLVLEDASVDDRVHQPVVKVGHIGPALWVPLTGAQGPVGTLLVGNLRGGRRFTEDDINLVSLFAAQAGLAVANARIREELERLAVLEDRERIAKELHDGVIQTLFAVGMSLQAADTPLADPTALHDRLASAVADIDRAIRDLRNFIFGLEPGGLADRQLDQALRDLVDELRRGCDLAIRVDIDPESASLLTPHAPNVLQLVREAMSNAIRHADAQTISVELGGDGEALTLAIEDDGSGFDPEGTLGGGRGLRNLRARAEAIGGRLDIESRSERGTTVRLRVPL